MTEAVETNVPSSFLAMDCEGGSFSTLDPNLAEISLGSDSRVVVLNEPVIALTMLIPPALAPMKPTSIDVQFSGVFPDADVRLVVHQQSTVLLERPMQQAEIRFGKATVEIPAAPEGMVSFLLITEKCGSQFIMCCVPCCIVPSTVLQDINHMLVTMCSIATESDDLPEEVSDDQSRLLWVWNEHFCKFLRDVELLFGLIDASETRTASIVEVMANMLKQCCFYGAWEFAAYVLSKAVQHGIRISPDPSDGCNKITAESLKTAVQNCPEMPICELED